MVSTRKKIQNKKNYEPRAMLGQVCMRAKAGLLTTLAHKLRTVSSFFEWVKTNIFWHKIYMIVNDYILIMICDTVSISLESFKNKNYTEFKFQCHEEYNYTYSFAFCLLWPKKSKPSDCNSENGLTESKLFTMLALTKICSNLTWSNGSPKVDDIDQEIFLELTLLSSNWREN